MESLKSLVNSWIDWGDSLLGEQSALCWGVRTTTGCTKVRDCGKQVSLVCSPEYMPTVVEELEMKRQRLALVLAGQLTVVIFRLLTGHVGAAAIGAIIFVVGNQARCSLATGSLTTYTVLGFSVGTLDAIDLVTQLCTLGGGFILFPFTDNVMLDLSAAALMLAPVTEVVGARIALASYLQPSMLMWQPQHMMPVGHGMPYGPVGGPGGYGYMPCLPPPGTTGVPWGHQQPQLDAYCANGNRPVSMDQASRNPSVVAIYTPRQDGHSTPPNTARSEALSDCSLAGPSLDRPKPQHFLHSPGIRRRLADSPSPDGLRPSCAACEQIIRDTQAVWHGKGAYRDEVYCSSCWAKWWGEQEPERTRSAS